MKQHSTHLALIALLLCVGWGNPSPNWQAYTYQDAIFVPDALSPAYTVPAESTPSPCPHATYPASWQIITSTYTDVTGDGAPECVLLVWRPWEDWPIMRWSQGASPIAAHQDAEGYSAHIILTRPDPAHGYRELWAGSALALPILELDAADVNGDGENELVALEGDYTQGRKGPAQFVAVWHWNGFGFTLDWRSPPGRFTALHLTDWNHDGHADILVK